MHSTTVMRAILVRPRENGYKTIFFLYNFFAFSSSPLPLLSLSNHLCLVYNNVRGVSATKARSVLFISYY